MKESLVSRIAVTILAIVMAVFGSYHFLNAREMIVFVPDFLPGGIIWVYLVGIAFIVAALSFFTHRYMKFAGYMLGVILIIFVLTLHLPNWLNSGDKEMRNLALTNLLKDSAIAAFALYIASKSDNT